MITQRFIDVAAGNDALQHQRRRGSFDEYDEARSRPVAPGLGPDEIEFLTERDSFYLASIGERGWPYVQHRGGPVGFIRVVDATHIAWADRPGNRQYLSAGNIDFDDRVAMIAVDYPNRRRLKLLGHARFDVAPDEATLEALGIEGRMEALVVVEIEAFAWNCPKFIQPRFTTTEVETAVEPLRRRIRELEVEVQRLSKTGG